MDLNTAREITSRMTDNELLKRLDVIQSHPDMFSSIAIKIIEDEWDRRKEVNNGSIPVLN